MFTNYQTLESKPTQQSEGKQRAELILAKVKELCILGSTNKSGDALRAFKFLIQAAQRLLDKNNPDNKIFLQKISVLNQKERKSLTQNIRKYRNELIKGVFNINFSSIEAKKHIEVTCSLESLTDPNFLKLIHLLYSPTTVFHWNQVNFNMFAAVLASHLRDYNEKAQYLKTGSNKGYQKALLNQGFFSCPLEELPDNFQVEQDYNDGIEIDALKLKDIWFKRMIKDVMNCAVSYGTGNCAIMADCAFLAAISLDISEQITYIRFFSEKNSKIDVVNAIAIGNWPEPGCVVISPWQLEGISYTWQGEVTHTPEIMALSQEYDGVKIIARIDPTSDQAKKWKENLVLEQFDTWHTLPLRRKNLDNVKKCFTQLLDEMIRLNILQEDKKKELLDPFIQKINVEESKEKEEEIRPTISRTLTG